jgi:hypothetical protein
VTGRTVGSLRMDSRYGEAEPPQPLAAGKRPQPANDGTSTGDAAG